jgi:two-component system response regulator YesN
LPGFVVIGEAADGREALEMVEEVSPDVLILDVQMPVLDGIEVIETLQQSGADVLILVLSAIDDPMFTRELLLMGACQFIVKGDVAALLRGVKQAYQGECQKTDSQSHSTEPVHIY